MRILYAQLFTNIPLHYHVCDGLCLNLTQLFILVLIMIALTGFKIFIENTAIFKTGNGESGNGNRNGNGEWERRMGICRE